MEKFDKRLSFNEERVTMRAPKRAASEFEDRTYAAARQDVGYDYGDDPPSEVTEISEFARNAYGPERALAFARLCAGFNMEHLKSYTKITVPNERAILDLCLDKWHEVEENAWVKADGKNKLPWLATGESAIAMANTLLSFIAEHHANKRRAQTY